MSCRFFEKKGILKFVLLCMVLLLLFVTAGCPAPAAVPPAEQAEAVPQAPEVIRIGYAISLTGPFTTGAATSQLPNYKLWAEEVNARGGIYLPDYGKRVPVELIEYDDRSDIETAIRLVEKLIVEDKVDFVLPPWGTGMNFAIAPLVNEHGFPVMASTFQSMKFKEIAHTLPYFFTMLPKPDVAAQGLMDYLISQREKGAIGNRVAVIFVNQAVGVEMAGAIVPALALNDFELVYYESYPLGIADLSPTIKAIMAEDPDVFIALTHPPDAFMLAEQSKALGFNPPIYYSGVGTSFTAFRDALGAAADGVSGIGVWNPNVPITGASDYFEAHKEVADREPDRWASAYGYASLQILEQAIERVGSIDRAAIREVIATEEFDTIIGRVRFENQLNMQHPGLVGQWQGGEYQVIWPRENATAQPLMPKPDWP